MKIAMLLKEKFRAHPLVEASKFLIIAIDKSTSRMYNTWKSLRNLNS